MLSTVKIFGNITMRLPAPQRELK